MLMVNERKQKFFEQLSEQNLAITYDDVLLEPVRSQVSPEEVSLTSWFSRNVPLKVPLVSAAMDTITEAPMAITMAKMGGLGVIHAGLSPEAQKQAVRKVKLYLHGLIENPIVAHDGSVLSDLLRECDEHDWSFRSFPVIGQNGKLIGMLTQSDIDFCSNLSSTVESVMTPMQDVVCAPGGTTVEQAYRIMAESKKKTLPLLDADGKVQGLYVFSDVRAAVRGDTAKYNLDAQGRLRVAAALPTDSEALDRLREMYKYLDVVVLDTAQGDSKYAFQTLEQIKSEFPDLDVVVGNISVGASARGLAQAGADGIKVGQGGGCLAADTPVLMADQSLRPISEVQEGDWVMNRDNKPVRVLWAARTGVKEVVALHGPQMPTSMFATPDHCFWTLDRQEQTTRWTPAGELTGGAFSISVLAPGAESSNFTHEYVVQNLGLKMPVYDIEVADDTHSFIAGGCAVHNSICTTRVETGMGKPQVSAVYEAALAVSALNVPVCADGGITKRGDVSIAIAAGASSVMMGRMLSGTDETPGAVVVRPDRSRVKRYRGMGSATAIRDSSSSRKRYGGSDGYDPVPEGVEAEVPYQGSAVKILADIDKALRKSFSYVNSPNVPSHQADTTFNRITHAGVRESHPHDVEAVGVAGPSEQRNA